MSIIPNGGTMSEDKSLYGYMEKTQKGLDKSLDSNLTITANAAPANKST